MRMRNNQICFVLGFSASPRPVSPMIFSEDGLIPKRVFCRRWFGFKRMTTVTLVRDSSVD